MYSKLRNDREIRLITLKAGHIDDSISCCLRRVNLSNLLKFEALSYEWKQAHGSTSITCNGNPRPVTSNLALALRALRFPSRPRVLWVDAICINQEDPEEKAKQIPLMREIYASATSVLTWLGPGFLGAKEAFDILPYLCMVGVERHPTGKPDTEKMEDLIAANLNERPKHGSIIQSQKDFMFLTHDRDSVMWRTIPRHPELDDDVLFRFHDRKAWNAIDQLFCNTYFERSWIIQEVAVAEMVYVLCGSYILPWDIFRMAYEGRSKLMFQRFRHPLGDEFPSLVPCVRDARLRYRNSNETRSQDLATALTSFSYSKQTDPRDIVYAALGLITLQSPCADIVPDYSKSTEDVFYEASCRIIESRKDLYLWSCKSLMSRRSMSLPSWVPEWTMKPCEEALEFASPLFSRSLPGNPSSYNRSLFVDGHLLDVVDATFSGYFGRAPAETIKRGQVVAVLGGAYVPYLLQKQNDHYQLISHAYVEGIMTLSSLPVTWKVERIEIR